MKPVVKAVAADGEVKPIIKAAADAAVKPVM